MKYAQTGNVEFCDGDGDTLVLRAEPTGSQYDERQGLLGSMRFPGNLINENTNMEELFAGGEMVEVNLDKKNLAEFQFKSLFVSMTAAGRMVNKISDAIGIYRQLDKESKDWIDKQVDSVWKKHEEDVKAVEAKEGESEASPSSSSGGDAPPSDSSNVTPISSMRSEIT